MKKKMTLWIAILLIATLLVGCGPAEKAETTPTEPPATVETEAPTEAPTEVPTEVPTEEPTEAPTETPTEAPAEEPTEEDVVYETEASSYYIDEVYAEQIDRYHTALSEKWDEGKYFENDMSALPYYYYEGNPLDNVGFGFVDLDNDGYLELVIGAIMNADKDPAVFEVWTMVDGKPVMLVQGGSRNRYVLQFTEEDEMWYIVNEASNSAFNHATYYLMLNEGKLEVVQGIVFDASANEQNPWFLTYDMDWDASNDQPIDEETADAILESNRTHYTALEYFPYLYYK